MLAIAERIDLTEQIVVSVETGSLRVETGRVRSVERVAALGAVQRHAKEKPDAHGQHQAVLDLGMELAAALIRAKYLHDRAQAERAKYLFALRLRNKAGRQPRRLHQDQLLQLIAVQVLNEWVHDQCPKCKGAGIHGALMGGHIERLRACEVCGKTGRVLFMPSALWPDGKFKQRPAGPMRPFAISCPACRGKATVPERAPVMFRLGKPCPRCDGKGFAPARHHVRARLLNVSQEAYERHWKHWFEWGLAHLARLDERLLENLHRELRY